MMGRGTASVEHQAKAVVGARDARTVRQAFEVALNIMVLRLNRLRRILRQQG
jgi:hypothetical protein